jgi:DNA-binding MarR family transcriptional regulator
MTDDTRGGTTGDHQGDLTLGERPAMAEEDVSQLVLTIMRLFRGLERVPSGLTPQQYRILKLAGAGGERSARLAERLTVAKPTLTATADGLVAAGYMRRDAEPGDRRVVRLCLTPAGRTALDRADAAYCGWLDRLLGATADAEQVLDAFATIDAALEELRCSRSTAPDAPRDPAAQIDQAASSVTAEKTLSQPRAERAARRSAGRGAE